MERSCLVSDLRPTLAKGESDKNWESRPVEVPREDRKVFTALTGQIVWSVFPIIIVCIHVYIDFLNNVCH